MSGRFDHAVRKGDLRKLAIEPGGGRQSIDERRTERGARCSGIEFGRGRT
ncbi:MAG: hypothetical protein H0W18_05725 [Acidobacteria bacterium]|nr:hypothetical protein [Acidobacteriota bacterium]